MKVPAGSTEFIPWKDAADEIVGMMKKVRQESSEGGNIEITGTITVEQYNLYIWIFLRCAFFCKKFCFHLICKMFNIYKMCYMGINSNITKNKIRYFHHFLSQQFVDKQNLVHCTCIYTGIYYQRSADIQNN